MKKNTIDIIDRARQLADLQNSDFIGWKENNNLLNEAYIKLYTELINHKDRFYIKSISISELEEIKTVENGIYYKLPEDFYMLNSITMGVGCDIVLRKAPEESNNSYRYDIVEGCLVLYGGVEKTSLNIEYWKTPITLVTKAPIRIISLPEGYKWIDASNNKYLGYKKTASSTEFILFNLKTNTAKTLTLNSAVDIEEGLYSDLFAIVKYISNDTPVYKVLDFYNGNISNFTSIFTYNKIILGKKDNKCYVLMYIPSESRWKLTDNYYTENVELEYIPENTTRFTFTGEEVADKKFYFLEAGYIYNDEGEIPYSNVLNYIDSYNGDIYYETMQGVFKNDEKILTKFKSYEFLLAVNKVDTDTGYGITALDEDLQYKVYSAFKDTEIEFPNNFYFQYMAYLLAISYKAKQNADSTALQDLASNEVKQFYNSISQDANQELRIKNVYSTNWGF